MSKRIRAKGRDFNLYMFTNGSLAFMPANSTQKALQDKLSEILGQGATVGALNCSLNSTNTYTKVLDKSTPKEGLKQLEETAWNFSSDYNIANLAVYNALFEAHKSGRTILCALATHYKADSVGLGSGNSSLAYLSGKDGDTAESTRVEKESGNADRGLSASQNAKYAHYGVVTVSSITLTANDGGLATFSMTLEGEGELYSGDLTPKSKPGA